MASSAHSRRQLLRSSATLGAGLLFLALCGCTSLSEYVHNGFKVGPNYQTPSAARAPDWIDAADKRVRSESDDLSKWWTVFNDPVLDGLIDDTYRQNLTLRQAGERVLQARAQLGIATGNLFPQTQQLNASFTQTAQSGQIANVVLPTPAGTVSLQAFLSAMEPADQRRRGRSISGAASVAPSRATPPISTPPWQTTATCW